MSAIRLFSWFVYFIVLCELSIVNFKCSIALTIHSSFFFFRRFFIVCYCFHVISESSMMKKYFRRAIKKEEKIKRLFCSYFYWNMYWPVNLYATLYVPTMEFYYCQMIEFVYLFKITVISSRNRNLNTTWYYWIRFFTWFISIRDYKLQNTKHITQNTQNMIFIFQDVIHKI